MVSDVAWSKLGRSGASVLCFLALFVAGVFVAGKGVAAEQVDFEKHVRPILMKHCVECHGPDTQDGGIRWDQRKSAMRGGDSGVPSIVAGKPDTSELIKRLTTDDEDERMPAETDPLAEDEIELIRRWVAQGAVWPDDGSDAAPKHWAYIAPTRPAAPEVKQADWPSNPIDRFRASATRVRRSRAVAGGRACEVAAPCIA